MANVKNLLKKIILKLLFLQIQLALQKIFQKVKTASIAAIASELSAKIYNLKILKKNIEDEEGNVTRFLIMGKNINQPDYQKNKKFITSCIFRLKSTPSALI